MVLTSGTRFGAYEILSRLGAGGMGEVYRARDLRLHRDVAVKVLPDQFVRDPERLARFEREARMIAGLSHPNIVTLFSLEEEGGVRFLTMELIEGSGLDQHVVPGGLPIERALELGIALADALIAAHAKGVVHRDLKPANVMLTREGHLKVLDFGLAKLAQSESSLEETRGVTTSPLSHIGQVLGTVPYMAPEQLRGDRVDARTDLFAFGIILYELLSGRRPFFGETSADITSAILRDRPEPLPSLRADLPEDLDRVVDRCLRKDPRDRYPSAIELANDLRALKRAREQVPSRPVAQAPRTEELLSIAVLPFVNRSPDPEDEYFSDGLADELLNVLAKIRGFRVAARTSSFHWKGKDTTIAEVGKALKVATVLEGSVRKSGNRVRISVQLVKVSDGFHLWSETYDRTLDDVFAVQDDIAQSVVKELRTKLLGEEADSKASGEARAEVAAAVKDRGHDPEAHRLYLQARHFADRLNFEDMKKAVAYLEAAIEREPQHALAWAQLAHAYALEATYGWVPGAEGFEKARNAVTRALELAPDLAQAHAVLSRIQSTYDFDFKGAEASSRRALELAPANPEVLLFASVWPLYAERAQEAIAAYLLALEKDPLSSSIYVRLGVVYRAADRPREALAAFDKALELAPRRVGIRMIRSLVYLAEGDPESARREAELEPAAWARLVALAAAYHAEGRTAESDAALHELEGSYADECASQIAVVHAFRGSIDQAFHWLDRAYQNRDAGIAAVPPEPIFRPLHDDPRWKAFLRKLGLTD